MCLVLAQRSASYKVQTYIKKYDWDKGNLKIGYPIQTFSIRTLQGDFRISRRTYGEASCPGLLPVTPSSGTGCRSAAAAGSGACPEARFIRPCGLKGLCLARRCNISRTIRCFPVYHTPYFYIFARRSGHLHFQTRRFFIHT